ncbi:MAG: MFS transporter [Luteibacter sp.]
MDTPVTPSPSVFRHRDFALFWWSRVLANLAAAAESVTIGWTVYAVARQNHISVEQGALLVGMVGLVQFVPVFCLTLFAGETADRYDRRKLMMLCVGAEIVCVLALGTLALHPSPSLAPIFIAAAVFGAARAFLSPASSAMGPMLVPREELPRAVAWSSLAWQGAAIFGPSAAGLLISISPAVAFFTAGGLYSLSVVALWLIKGNTQPVVQAGSRFALMREGLAYVWTNKIVLGAISLDLFAVLLGGATALLPIFARDILHTGPWGLGLLRAAPAVGALLMSIWLSRNTLERRVGPIMFASVAGFGVSTLVFAVSTSLWLSIGALFALGAFDMVSMVIRGALVQLETPDDMRGRVSAVNAIFINTSNQLGEFESGILAAALGAVNATLIGGIGTLVVVGLWMWWFPSLRRRQGLVSDPEPVEGASGTI